MADAESEEGLDPDESMPTQRLLQLARDLEDGDEVRLDYIRDGQSYSATVVAEEAAGGEVAEAVAAPSPDEPRIDTTRCSSCNECILINDRMFRYDGNKQAFIADLSAGTYAELVLAAERCQVAVIHPGKPINPDEPGLEDLLKRAEQFL